MQLRREMHLASAIASVDASTYMYRLYVHNLYHNAAWVGIYTRKNEIVLHKIKTNICDCSM